MKNFGKSLLVAACLLSGSGAVMADGLAEGTIEMLMVGRPLAPTYDNFLLVVDLDDNTGNYFSECASGGLVFEMGTLEGEAYFNYLREIQADSGVASVDFTVVDDYLGEPALDDVCVVKNVYLP